MVATSDTQTTVAVLAGLVAFLFWVGTLCYVRYVQFKENTATALKRRTENPMGLPQLEQNWGYRFDFQDPRNNIENMSPSLKRAYNVQLHQAETLAIFLAVIPMHIALRGTRNGSSQVAILALVHTGMRISTGLSYYFGFSVLRSATFGIALVSLVGMYVLLLESLGIADDGPGGDDDEVGT